MKTLIHPDAALELILEGTVPLPPEDLPLGLALGRRLARDLEARIDSPPFDKSAMDGFALAGPQPAEGYRLVGTIAAGARGSADRLSPPDRLAPGQAARIMTGAALPPGAERVQRFEWSESRGDRVFCVKPESASNIIRRGENLKRGDPLLSRRRLEPQDIGILASSGWAAIPVAGHPRVGVLSTGDEIRPAGDALRDGEIWDSNGPQLLAQASAAGAEARWYGIVPDQPDTLRAVLERALAETDVVVVSGGVSLGDFDHVPAALAACGVEAVFHQLQMRPGKPTWFGRRPAGPCAFGLPGNPVSTFVNFEVLVRPLLARLSGQDPLPRLARGVLRQEFRRRNPAVVEFFPVRLEGGFIQALAYHGSSMLNVLGGANALLRLEIGEAAIPAGEERDVRPIRP